MEKNSFLVMSPGRMGGEGIELILDYLRMCLHLDIIKFNRMLSQIQKYEEELWDLYGIMGEADACIAVAEYRAFLPEYECPKFQRKQEICTKDMYHPLIEDAVSNSLDMIFTFCNSFVSYSSICPSRIFSASCMVYSLLTD